ncbi:hypothetical protein KUV75_05620 [Qipengyuania gaetbuli]|uniref:hypothetical protein n=1 Tax=Qipengyuania gaetbuli TaxID=266952 RepID=UPI001C99DFB6|nr:hypothetical protein [Qipengyuania gaetbuli]MBY6014377.1 hypothetical protein [Qipengyuania gaetbuli]
MKHYILGAAVLAACGAAALVAAPPEGKGGGNGGGGGEDPPAEPFAPAIAYFDSTKTAKQLRLANRAGDQACMVVETPNGGPTLRGFTYHAASKRLAYSIGETGIYVTSWGSDPCKVDTPTRVRTLSGGDHPEVMDFSPDGRYVIWTEPIHEYTGFGSPYLIYIYDFDQDVFFPVPLDQWGGEKVDWGVDGEWGTSGIRFSPDFATSNEVIFIGAPLDGSAGLYDSVFAYDISGDTPPRLIYDGENLSIEQFVSVTNPEGQGEAQIVLADRNSGELIQLTLDGTEVRRFGGSEPAYSCDNSEILYQYSAGKRRNSWFIASVDGTNAELWSTSGRYFDWFCP